MGGIQCDARATSVAERQPQRPWTAASTAETHTASAPRRHRGGEPPGDGQADAVLGDAGKVVIPDIVANAGTVTVSYFRWWRPSGSFGWEEECVTRSSERRSLAHGRTCTEGRRSMRHRFASPPS
ncbi:MAG: hypothetical protein M3304_08405 [Actinomycetota bacterium]|nr:hypothetical protein [Actinomycetota bacterium]